MKKITLIEIEEWDQPQWQQDILSEINEEEIDDEFDLLSKDKELNSQIAQ